MNLKVETIQNNDYSDPVEIKTKKTSKLDALLSIKNRES